MTYDRNWFAYGLAAVFFFGMGCNTVSERGTPSDAGADRGVTTGAGGGGVTGAGGRPDAGASAGGSTGAGGRGGAGGAGAGGNGTAGASGNTGAGGGTTGTPSCTNNRKDGTETGVDCGGSCPACPTYKIDGPNKSNAVQSSCQGGGGYMCARQMVLSPEFKQAAFEDWGSDDPPFVYGVAGHDLDAGGLDPNSGNACCQCYQLIFESPTGATGLPIPKPMIVQTFNTAAGGGHNFDIYMAAGGFGANNGCTGGASPMYTTYPDLGGNFTGGVRASRYSQCATNNQWTQASIASSTCQSFVGSQCAMIQSTVSATNQSTSQDSCNQSNLPGSHYHINWSVRAMRVECPVNLTRVTGCKLNGQGLPQANPAAKDVASATSAFRTGYTTTTMQDCCRPTCAYPANVANADATYSVYYTCDRAGVAQ
jgi:hypothetical protein